MSYLFTSESVSEGHPDKIADRISDALLDNFLAFDPNSKVACETLVTTGQVILSGEVKTKSYVDLQTLARKTINDIGYTKGEYQFSGASCGVISLIHEQSPEINQGVDKGKEEEQGAGDQGMMFGYATDETESYMPLACTIAHKLVQTLSEIRKQGRQMTYLRPDGKSQVTIEYDDNDVPIRIKTLVISVQHDDFDTDERMRSKIQEDIKSILIPMIKLSFPSRIRALFDADIEYYINYTGRFVIGGPHGDTGLTGRKIIVDTYGGKGAHGGGAFSGKDPSKVDRSSAYAARHIAKNLVASGVSSEVLVQISYAIGSAEPISLLVNTYGKSQIQFTDSEISEKVSKIFDLRPSAIEKRLKLRNPIYEETSAYGHMGRTPRIIRKNFSSPYNGEIDLEVELFTWEKLDYVDKIKKAFGI